MMMDIAAKIVFILLLAAGVGVRAAETDEEAIANRCVTPCEIINETCVSISCYRSSVTTQCKIYSLHASQTDKHATTCVSPKDVKGLPEFCQTILDKTKPQIVENILIERTTISGEYTTGSKNVSYLDDRCLSATALASVAVGSFAGGCFVMWLIMAVLRCLRPCKTDKTNDSYVQMDSREVSTISNQGSRSQASRSRYSDQRQPSSASVDSGLSSTQVTTPSHTTQDQRRNTANGRLFCFASSRLPESKGEHMNTYEATQEEGVYAPSSECSFRDYQSIQDGSVYAPSSEGGNSDYSGQPTHRVLFIRENGEIYQASSESSSNDYTSLKGNNANGFGIYYPTSDSSCKDYSSLLDEGDLATGYCDVEDMLVNGSNHDNVKFRVSGFVIPKQKLSTKGRPAPALENVNEYEVLNCNDNAVMADEYTTPIDDISGNRSTLPEDKVPEITTTKRLPMDGFHLSELARSDLQQRNSLPHRYVKLDPESKQEPEQT